MRVHAIAAAERMKAGDGVNDFLDRALEDPAFNLTREQVDELMNPSRFIGRAPQQVVQFIAEEIEPVLAAYPETEEAADVRV